MIPSAAWRWSVCGLLLLATMLNYMDRQVLSNTAVHIKYSLQLSDTDYGLLEMAFSFSFALGGLLFGWLADRTSLRWLYAAVVLLWSAAGMATALVGSFAAFFICRACLGFAESGHWPCAIRTTRRILPPRDRPLGNGLLQSGAATGAFLTPLVIAAMVDKDTPSHWPRPFLLVGAAGIVWMAAWLLLFRGPRTSGAASAGSDPEGVPPRGEIPAAPVRALTFREVLLDRRVWVLAALSGLFNTAWQFLRAWLPLYMEEGRGYTFKHTLNFTAYYYIAADLGCIACGWLTSRLARRGLELSLARRRVMLLCALLSSLAAAAAFLPRGPLFQALLLLVGFGSLGIFPNFYALCQEISEEHQGKVMGLMGLSCWALVGTVQPLVGYLIDQVGRERGYLINMTIGAFLPLAGMALLGLFWPLKAPRRKS